MDRSRSRSPEPKFTPCLCGQPHRYAACWYLNEMAPNRPTNFKPAPRVVAKIEDYFAKNPTHRERIAKTIIRKPMKSDTSVSQRKKALRTTSATGAPVSMSPDTYEFINFRPLVQKVHDETNLPARKGSVDEKPTLGNAHFSFKESWMYTGGSDTHVCNSKSSYESYTEYDTPRYIDVRNLQILVLGTGSVKLTVEGSNGPTIITLLDTAYAPAFHTNLVSQFKFRKRGFLFNEVTGWIVDTNTAEPENHIKPILQGDFWYLAHRWTAPQSTPTTDSRGASKQTTVSTRSSQCSDENVSSTRNTHFSQSSRERAQVSHWQETIETPPEMTEEIYRGDNKDAGLEQLPTPDPTPHSTSETYLTSSPTLGNKIPCSTAAPRTAGVLLNSRSSSTRTLIYIILAMTFLLLWGKLYPHLINFLPFS
jgi:hypothetical protein